jgi:hypothetical protein
MYVILRLPIGSGQHTPLLPPLSGGNAHADRVG